MVSTEEIGLVNKNAVLLDEIKKRQRLLEAIGELTKIITSDANLDNIYETFSEKLRELIDFDRASIALIEGDNIRYFAVSSKIKTERLPGSIYPLKDSNTGWVAIHKKTLIHKDITKKQMLLPINKVKLEEGIRSSIHVPLFYKGEVFGSINLSSLRPGSYGEWEKEVLEQLVGQIAGAIMNASLYKKLQEESRIDTLTGLFNRHYFNKRLDEEIKRWHRNGRVFSLAICDLDYFRDYNNRYGHLAGDKLLREAGELIKSSIREIDLAFRYGGDEFAILLPGVDCDDALRVVKRVQRVFEEEMKRRKIPLTCSFGLASYPIDGAIATDIMNAADTATYRAKELGGNQCISSRILKPTQKEAVSQAKAEETVINILCSLALALELRDIYTYGHSRDVNKYALMLGEATGLSREKLTNLSRASLLHDIGKVGISDEVLFKKGRLSKRDWSKMKKHPVVGAQIIGYIPGLLYCRPTVLHHHERWDGKGYPSGIKGKKIPLEARILAIADAFAAMTSDRPYRPAMSYQDALLKLEKEAGRQFDPELVKVFIGVVKENLLPNDKPC